MQDEYEEELEAEEKKHRKFIKYDMELFIVLIIVVVFITAVNLILKSEYKSISSTKPDVAPAVVECNKNILNAAETYHKNSSDSAARATVDGAKASFDAALAYYGRTIKKGTEEAVFLSVVDSCYMTAFRFRSVLRAQKDLGSSGVSDLMLNNVDTGIRQLKQEIDSMVVGIDAYNQAGFILKFNWLTPYPGKIEYNHASLPDLEPIVALPAEQ